MQDIVPKGRSIRKVTASEKAPEKKTPERDLSRPIPIKKVQKVQEKVERLERKLEREEDHLDKEIEHLEKEEEHIEALRRARSEFETHNKSIKKAKRGNKRLWIGLSVVAVVGLAILVSTVFHGADVLVSPKVVAANVGGDYAAKKTAAKGELAFESITVKQTGSEAVKASGEETVNKKATGVVVIYNNYSSASQRLIKNTRFETPEGLIYRITDSVTVPGKTGTTPGQVEAVITADETGDKYNAGLKDFTIPGFKGDPRYSAFYARSKTALAGGFSGVRKVVAESDRKAAEEKIRSKLRTELLTIIKKQVTEDKLFFDKGYSIDFVSLPEEAMSNSEVLVKVEGSLSAAVFNKKAFSSYAASKAIKGYQNDAVIIKDPESIFFTPKSDFRPATNPAVSFTLSGTPSFEWIYDESVLKDALKGADRDEVVGILQKFPMIEKADISIRPFWRGSFPDSVSRINIKKAE
jgi:hypothetical protein